MARIGTRRALVSRPAAAGGNWWEFAGQTCVVAYQAKGAADLAASYVNLANPGTYNAAPGTAPTFDTTTGWTFNGSDQYLTTGYNNPTTQTFTMIARFSNAATTMQGMLGAGVTSGRYVVITPCWNPGFSLFGSGNALYGSSPALTSGVIAVAGRECFIDGSSVATLSAAAGSSSAAFTIGVLETNRWFSGKIQAAAIYSTILSAADVATLTTRMNAL